ncbi:hypothetical protein [Streptococcus suis]
MKFFRELKTDYLESRFSAYESFAEWFLKRKLGFWGKMIFAYLLWLVWIFFFSHPHYIIFFFYVGHPIVTDCYASRMVEI